MKHDYNEGTCVYVRWVDSAVPGSAGWVHDDEIHTKPCVAHSVGWVRKNRKKSLTLVSSRIQDEPGRYGVITIPKGAILKSHALKEQ